MQRRHLDFLGEGDQAARERGAVFVVGRQQAGSCDWRKRNGREQLGVIAHAVALEGVGPGVVEHVLAARMGLQVKRHCPRQRITAPKCQVVRRPSRCRRGAFRFVQRAQECVP
ncbi:hypothetical protein D3C73_1159170 [compost metagenome]